MQTKQPLYGTGLYYIALEANKDYNIFQSVFEYENIKPLIANIEHIQLLAFFFEPKKAQLVIECENDWPEVVEQLQTVFSDMHYSHWRKRHNIIADEAKVLLVEKACLMPLVMQLHRQPVKNKWVAQADMYPFSSDYLYRLENPPAWINTHEMLKQLSHSRRNQIPYYEQTVLKELEQEFDLEAGTDADYRVIGREGFALRVKAHKENLANQPKQPDLKPVYESALKQIANTYDVTVETLEDPNNRQTKTLTPLVIWLTLQARPEKNALAKILDIEEQQIDYFERSVHANHSQAFLDKLVANWPQRANSPSAKTKISKDANSVDTSRES